MYIHLVLGFLECMNLYIRSANFILQLFFISNAQMFFVTKVQLYVYTSSVSYSSVMELAKAVLNSGVVLISRGHNSRSLLYFIRNKC